MNSEIDKETACKIKDLKSFILFQTQVLGSFRIREVSEPEEERPLYLVSGEMKDEIIRTLRSISNLGDVKDYFREEISELESIRDLLDSQNPLDQKASEVLFEQIRTLSDKLRPKRPWLS